MYRYPITLQVPIAQKARLSRSRSRYIYRVVSNYAILPFVDSIKKMSQ